MWCTDDGALWRVECESHEDCPAEKACINQACIEVCSLRESCGQSALCQPVQHHARCVCPQCHSGDPRVACIPDPKCQETTPVPPKMKCRVNSHCPSSQSCHGGECRDPCLMSAPTCDPNKVCRVRNHRPQCVCKYGFSLSSSGELRCAPEQSECRRDADCPSNEACINNKCQTPCAPGICSKNRTCLVLDHKPVCVCTENCHPEVFICLRDAGCPPSLTCRNYQCVNPCLNTSCPQDAPCFVEDHKAVCRFCPQGYSADPKNGCVKGNNIVCLHSYSSFNLTTRNIPPSLLV